MALTVSPSVGPIFWIGASYEDRLNYFYGPAGGTGPVPFSIWSDGYPWTELVSQYFGQNGLGRYTPAGIAGHNYAVGGSSFFWGSPYTIANQITLLLNDYGGHLPSGAIVVLGAYWPNDLEQAVSIYNGVWAPPTGPQSWQVGSSGGFTVPASGTIAVTCVSTTGMVAGASNTISFQASGQYYGPFVINTVNSSTLVTVNTNATWTSVVIPNNAVIQTSGAGQLLNLQVGVTSASIASLVAALPSNGYLVIVNSPDISLMPLFSSYSQGLTNCHNTWLWYGANIIAPFLPVTAPKVISYDMSAVLNDVVTNFPPYAGGMPGKYGFKNVNAGLGGTFTTPVPTGYNASDWAFWDGTTGVTTTGIHPTGAMHKIYAYRFVEFLKAKGIVSIY